MSVPGDGHGSSCQVSESGCPFLVAATAGTTVLGSFDPLDDVADVCEKYNLWYHVDVRVLYYIRSLNQRRVYVGRSEYNNKVNGVDPQI